MNKKEEMAYLEGERSAWTRMQLSCLANLGYEDLERRRITWILEREAVISRLRDLCRDFGDNDWKDKAHLGDIIEKHLSSHLYSSNPLIEFIKEVAKPPHPDSDPASLLETYRARAATILEEMEEEKI